MPKSTLLSLLDRFVGHAEEIIISVLLGAATLVVFAQVIARYVFQSGINWAPELVQYLFLWTVMIGTSYGVRHKVHLGVDVLAKKFPAAVRRYIALISVAISILFTAGMSYLSVFYVITAYKHELLSVDLEVPLWIPHLALPVGFAFVTIRFIQVGWLVFTGEMETVTKSGEPVADNLG